MSIIVVIIDKFVIAPSVYEQKSLFHRTGRCYTTGRENEAGYCTLNQFDPSE